MLMHHHETGYPRPQLVRENWQLLDGSWKFAFDDSAAGLSGSWQDGFESDLKINVPFTYETKLSGIGDETQHNTVWYERTFRVEPNGSRVLLHFEGSDYETTVWVNGRMAGTHRGGYARFSFDVTELLSEGDNRLTVMVNDSTDLAQPRGKQFWGSRPEGCFYVQTTGIWKSVWLECVPRVYLRALKLTPSWKDMNVIVEAELGGILLPLKEAVTLTAEVRFGDDSIALGSIRATDTRCTLVLPLNRPDLMSWGIRKWTTETPNLYDLALTLSGNDFEDRVFSYFGVRDFAADGKQVTFNERKFYQRLLLDQGYWKDSGMTPPDEEALIADIDAAQAMGFNGVRKHQKVEDERFLYWADVKGLIVWSEMGNAETFNDDAVEQFTREWMEVVRQNYSHPCIVTWVPFNESWGIGGVLNDRRQQQFTQAIYYLTKAFDPARPVITNDGWDHTCSDILTLHDYAKDGEFLQNYLSGHWDEILTGKFYRYKSSFAHGFGYDGQPVLVSECGGIAFESDSGWGYGGAVQNEEEFLTRFGGIIRAMQSIPDVCGFCYTQLTDVYQEQNGLLTDDRRFKVAPEKIRAIVEK